MADRRPGYRVTAQSSQVFWVLVQLPSPLDAAASDDLERGKHSPRYFVLSAQEVYDVWRKAADVFEKGYLRRNGRRFEGRGVPNITATDALPFEGRWEKITSRLR